ncbi:unnamed protein product, partial [Ectocarpus sp. 12 AP-2014]
DKQRGRGLSVPDSPGSRAWPACWGIHGYDTGYHYVRSGSCWSSPTPYTRLLLLRPLVHHPPLAMSVMGTMAGMDGGAGGQAPQQFRIRTRPPT